MEQPKPRLERQVARKLWIRELLDGELVVTEGLQPNILKTVRGEAGRVNVLGVVVQTEELPTPTIVVDDGTGTLTVRNFDRSFPFSVGDFVQIIGRPRVYQREPYVAAEAFTRTDPRWAAYRRAELGEPVATDAKPVPTPVATPEPEARESNAERIVKLIVELDRGDGAPIEDVVVKSKIRDAEAIIEQLLLAGDIFELRAGRVKVL